MNFIPTKLEGCYILEPQIYQDERGYFMESYNQQTFQAGINQDIKFVQDNQSFSSKGVLRGMHYQTGIHAQAKLVRVLQGEVLDVAVDIRPESKTFGQYVSVLLSGDNQKQFFIPRGFAHGFLVVSETATFFYKCDNFYNKESEGGLIFNDPTIQIDWEFPTSDLIISDKDKILPTLENARKIW
ncbi:dTDP-4-dehydrorhamnose 3,5-epimerase [Flavobacterium branchiophilum NBRC 15030 = ATCC 35035]|uniref:dTDP-4-dehydrorhamnose 3,5-epimerase n=2 Tax=Flavobacterium branchiophilum TaxID=55197 RepID=G2Z6A9_FLABF|nr:dTDP-4-dehydrorhamnose 3,5-epimerase [Flavobacterium branchiophilum]OXA79193.1 dTDP-4-dehydrorhamnose 3,5-epimerase [Flavobacterium branchiophilum NBRC 15030 = ATCC 35035]PDS23499.1 dTDP-4-dehydrorhamnose 3,5-epimerase [Flavobacterium branchiophilum]TQM40323.1 dTDP-4-dehydrorhamnose 3,5-epimerase [Flavobacterium branchiophilum]CCB70929.1 dTDP-4-dehydrorhamnose 3,5-epimerase [Flavobacterium branchiophilum FL-15]GEM56532.1 dTDP-4-dehydrorhamnose 3,5-epimerase [Flavobacterium branchiophilum NB